jgi:hypothetical protein
VAGREVGQGSEHGSMFHTGVLEVHRSSLLYQFLFEFINMLNKLLVIKFIP